MPTVPALGEALDLGNSSAPSGSALGGPSLSERPRPSPLPRELLLFPGLQALAALVPGVSQVDNESGFLGKRPHRRHPGILKLPCVRLPRALADAAQFMLLSEWRWERGAREEAETVPSHI